MEETYNTRAVQILSGIQVGQSASTSQSSDVEGDAVRRAAMTITGASETTVSSKAYERNDHVTITNGKEVMSVKFKKAEPLIKSGEWKIQ